MAEYEELYKEEQLSVLKDLAAALSHRDKESDAIMSMLKNVTSLRGDDGMDGISIKSVDTVQTDESITFTFTMTDDTEKSFTANVVKGEKGEPGKDGINGDSASITIGKVSYGDEPSIKNVGDNQHAILDIVLAKSVRGEDGKDGKLGRPGKDGEGFLWRGTWSPAVSYDKNDIVFYQGSSYIARGQTKGQNPRNEKANWNLVAQKGEDGRDGVSRGGGSAGQSGGGGAVSSVNSKTGDVVLDKNDIGLSNVDNTSDNAKPVSVDQAAADNLRVLRTGDTMSGTLTISDNGETPELRVFDADGSTFMQMFHNGGSAGFGTIQSNGFVLTSTSLYTAVLGASSPQLKVQYLGGSYNSVDIGHNDTDGIITTTGGMLKLAPAGQISAEGRKIQNLATPTSPQDAATKAYTDTQLAALVDSSPSTLDTLNELAAALGDDANFATTITNLIAGKKNADVTVVTSGDITVATTSNTNHVYIIDGNHVVTMPNANAVGTNRYTLKNDTLTSKAIAFTAGQVADGTTLEIMPGDSVDLVAKNGIGWSII